ncbi:alpha-E domain-containing protein [Zoogloea sp. 1C4]|uniref:alpha-E domain-containing protein n=1 Tax=Zoogloea sp. 1C4 TaxID=2570190 RepID=UPI001290A63A|nr:alpha-E domain-containing protein [Zoogloea sp. 1C4]
MLSRTADHLFWMARYMERAENTARILDVTYRLSLLPQNGQEVEAMWAGMLKIMELQDTFHAKHPAFTTEAVLEFMIFDRDNPGSIYRCLRATRENAHAVRGTLTSELWETSNATWLKMRDFSMAKMMETGPGAFFEWVKYRSHLSRGVTIGTMLQDEALRFIRLGTFLERADNTARILEVKYLNLLPGSESDVESTDYYQWSALLRSVSAFEVYRKVYRDHITPLRVAELLILRADMPRSLARCMKEVYSNLGRVANSRSAETERMAGELEAHLRFGRIERIFELGLRNYLEEFRDSIFDLGCRISDDFLIPASA